MPLNCILSNGLLWVIWIFLQFKKKRKDWGWGAVSWFSHGHRNGQWWPVSHTFANPDLGMYMSPQPADQCRPPGTQLCPVTGSVSSQSPHGAARAIRTAPNWQRRKTEAQKEKVTLLSGYRLNLNPGLLNLSPTLSSTWPSSQPQEVGPEAGVTLYFQRPRGSVGKHQCDRNRPWDWNGKSGVQGHRRREAQSPDFKAIVKGTPGLLTAQTSNADATGRQRQALTASCLGRALHNSRDRHSHSPLGLCTKTSPRLLPENCQVGNLRPSPNVIRRHQSSKMEKPLD